MKIGCIAIVEKPNAEWENTYFLGLECSKGRGLILPGGKWEPPETYLQCALRELYEETGQKGEKASYLFGAPDESGYYCFAFDCYVTDPQDGIITPEGKTRWATPYEFVRETKTFTGYYQMLFDVMGFF